MDFFDVAMGIEKEGEFFYRKLAEECEKNDLSGILNRLSKDEARHYKIFSDMKIASKDLSYEFSDSFDKAKEVFVELKKNLFENSCNLGQVALYKKAVELEKKSIEFYKEYLNEFEDTNQKSIIRKVLNEEKRHLFVLENIVELVERPKNWVENAEFTHLDEY